MDKDIKYIKGATSPNIEGIKIIAHKRRITWKTEFHEKLKISKVLFCYQLLRELVDYE